MSTGTPGQMKRNYSSHKRSGSLRFDTSRFRRNLQKHISRTKEKVLHNLDKGEKTDDEFIKKSEAILMKKQASTVKLQTEIKRHLKALKNVSASSRSLHETLLETYEDNWAGRKEFADALVTLDSSWLHYFNTLCTLLEQVGSHIDEFVRLKDKLEKRKRKLVDYNLAKRNLYLTSTAKRKDESKLKKAQRDLEFVETAYHSLNHELRTDLPVFYDSHVHFCCENWSYLLENEESMYTHLLSTVHKFMSSLDQLREGYQRSDYRLADVELSFSDINRSTLSLSSDAVYANGMYEKLFDSHRRGSVEFSHPVKPIGDRVQRHASAANRRSKSSLTFRSRSVGNVMNGEDSDVYGSLPGPLTCTEKIVVRSNPRPIDSRPISARSEDIYNINHEVYAAIDDFKETAITGASSASSVKRKGLELKVANSISGMTSSASSSISSRHHRSDYNDSPRVDKTPKTDNLALEDIYNADHHVYAEIDDAKKPKQPTAPKAPLTVKLQNSKPKGANNGFGVTSSESSSISSRQHNDSPRVKQTRRGANLPEEEVYNADHHVYAEIDDTKKPKLSKAPKVPLTVKRKDSKPKGSNNISGVTSCESSSISPRRHHGSPRVDFDAEHHLYTEIDDTKKLDRHVKRKDSEPKASNSPSGVTSSDSSSISSRHHNESPQVGKTKGDNLPLLMAVHPYSSQDEDELDLAINDLVQVLPWENESLKEDGWLFGMKLPQSKKGLFPENHTILFVT